MDYSRVLYPEQVPYLDMVLRHERSCLALDTGSGKTRIAIVAAMRRGDRNLIIASKTLIGSWENEIKTTFPDIKYEICTSSNVPVIARRTWMPNLDSKLILTTPEMIKIAYDMSQLEARFSTLIDEGFGERYYRYTIPQVPMLNDVAGLGLFFSVRWHTVVIDEIQDYLNLRAERTRGMACLISNQFISLSATPFNSPSAEKYLAFYVLHRFPTPATCPDSIPAIKAITQNRSYEGVEKYLIRGKVSKIDGIKISDIVITHSLNHEEATIYRLMKSLYKSIAKEADMRRGDPSYDEFSTFRSVMFQKLCQMLICALIPCTKCWIQMTDSSKRDRLADIFMQIIVNESSISTYLNSEESMFSSRFHVIVDTVLRHYETDKILIFSASRKGITLLNHFLKQSNIATYVMLPSLSIEKRSQLVASFNTAARGVMLLTYKLGAQGLNLQAANICIKMDLYWDIQTMNQALARVYRNGQTKNIISYTVIANTGMERGMIMKCATKFQAVKELMTGPQRTQVHSINSDECTKMIELDDNFNEHEKLRILTTEQQYADYCSSRAQA